MQEEYGGSLLSSTRGMTEQAFHMWYLEKDARQLDIVDKTDWPLCLSRLAISDSLIQCLNDFYPIKRFINIDNKSALAIALQIRSYVIVASRGTTYTTYFSM